MTELSRVAVVTGGSRGIGRGAVCELAAAGFCVVVNYRRDQAAAESSRAEAMTLGARDSITIKADVSDTEASQLLVDEVMSRFGRIDVWVHNAGVAPEVRADLLETSTASWDRVMNTNLRGPFFLTQRVARAMIRQPGHESGIAPQIQFITSVSSVFASSNRGEYCVSKAGLSMVAQLFAARLAEHGIHVFEIRPGIIETDMTAPVRAAYDERFANGLAPLNRWGNPRDVGRVVAALASGAFGYSTGNVVYVDGGMHLRRL